MREPFPEHKPRRIPSKKWRELINPTSRKATADLREGLSHAPLSAVVEAEADDALPDYDTAPDLAYANE